MVVLRTKCIVLGDSEVGKSAISQSFHSDGSTYPKNYYMTTGIDLIQKFIHLGELKNDIIDFFIFDSAGKDLFADVCEKNWDKPGMFALVFDITNANSFQNCQSWLQKIKKFFEPGKTVPGILIGNKKDLEKRRRVSFEDANEFAGKNSLKYFECSAKEYDGVEDGFQWLGGEFFNFHKNSKESVQQLE